MKKSSRTAPLTIENKNFNVRKPTSGLLKNNTLFSVFHGHIAEKLLVKKFGYG
jgi:hypothetical protein